MKLTGKCKEDFEKFLTVMFPEMGIKGTNWSELVYKWFIIQHQSMQYGVYVDFFDSVDIYIDSQYYRDELFTSSVTTNYGELIGIGTEFSRQRARIKAIEKANEIYNEKTKKRR